MSDEFSVGQRVVTNREFSGVPEGTQGVVDEDYGPGIMVAWDLPEKPLPDGYDRKPEDELRPMTTDPDGFSVPILRDGFDKETELRFLDPVNSPVPDGGGDVDTEFFVVDEDRSAVVTGPYASKERACEDAHERGPGHIVATRTVLEMVEVASTTTIRWENEEEFDIFPDGGHEQHPYEVGVRAFTHVQVTAADDKEAVELAIAEVDLGSDWELDEVHPSCLATDGGEEEWSPSCWDCGRELPRRRLNMFPVHIDNEDGLGYEVVDVPLCDGCRKDRMPTHECPRCGEEYLHLDRAMECCPDRHDFAPVPDGGLESRRFVFEDHRHVSYGPVRDSDLWKLTFTDDEIGRVEILLDGDAMYELWIEVSDTPFSRDGTEAGDLRREVVHETSGMDAEMLREVLDRVEEVNRGQW